MMHPMRILNVQHVLFHPAAFCETAFGQEAHGRGDRRGSLETIWVSIQERAERAKREAAEAAKASGFEGFLLLPCQLQ